MIEVSVYNAIPIPVLEDLAIPPTPERYTIPVPVRGFGLGTGIPAGARDSEVDFIGSEILGLDLKAGVNVVDDDVGVVGAVAGCRSVIRD